MPGQYAGNRGSAQEWISAFIKEGMTNTEIVKQLQDYGLGYRQQSMFADVNRLRLEQFAAEGIKGMDIYTPIPEKFMREWQGETEYKFRVVVQYKYTSGENGEQKETGTTLYYNEAPTVNQVLEDWNVRVKTLEGGFGSTTDIEQIDEIKEIDYFVNRPKE